MAQPLENPYRFTEDWFSHNIEVWSRLFAAHRPKYVLEIGSHEGRSAVWMMEIMSQIDGGTVVCVDTWEDENVRERFLHNINVATKLFPRTSPQIFKWKSSSILAAMRQNGELYDLIYVDGSHKASDVLSDAVDAFHLCKSGGIIIFDDYVGGLGGDILDMPKMAIDSFINCFSRDVEMLGVPINQIAVRKK